MKASDRRTCKVCGTRVSASREVCPVCALRAAVTEEALTENSASEPALVESVCEAVPHRFENYELMLDADGGPIELGRGVMGITYKAFDIDLLCPVTLKVISEKYVGDESARLRFLREARSAASVRDANVASVFHLGRTGGNYFYAMEFVEGETLERFVKRAGRLDVKLALEITRQVGAGLAAIHKRKLVHRDIKPSNIMVLVEEGGVVTAKIIDLGLSKPATDVPAEAAISTPGAFAGTPEFASPEQFAGVSVDIRSDLYSLGVTLWEMLTGLAPFTGTPAEVMHQHLRAPLPIDQLQGVPEPAIALLEVLLDKDPTERVQTPAQLLKVMPMIADAIACGQTITVQSLRKTSIVELQTGTRESPAKMGLKRISVARLPVTGSDVFGREEDLAFLDAAAANPRVNVVSIIAWAGVGKSTLVNCWLRRIAAEGYRSAELVFGWSFYRQGTSGQSSSADEFVDTALAWFGDPDPRVGTAWEKGERLAKLIAHHRTLLVLDGLEPLQYPPGPQEGRLREPALQALLRELAAFNTGLCIVTTRLPVADIAEHEGASALRRELERLPSDAGANLLRALGVKGREEELRTASDEFRGHCLALTLLGSYLTDAYDGDIHCRGEVSARLVDDARQGVHARKVMESYQSWFGEGPELAVLRLLGLFDRPADEKALGALLKPPAVHGLTESLTNLSPSERRTILARLRRARLLAGEDPHNPGQLDTHPLIREYFGEQLRIQRTEAWKECNRRLFIYYQALAPQLPESFRDMEPLFLAVICGCHAGLYREALHDVYLPRIQRDNASFAANVLGARSALLSVLAHFFKQGRWGSLVETDMEGQSLTPDDQLFLLMQTGLYLTHTRGLGAPEARICYERAEPLCHSLNRPERLYPVLMSQWVFSLVTGKLTPTMQLSKRVFVLAQNQNDAALWIGAYQFLAGTLYFLGDFEAARQNAKCGLQIWDSGIVQSPADEIYAPAIICLMVEALSEWHLGEISACWVTIARAISLAKELNDAHGLAAALLWETILGHFERNSVKVARLASDLIELCTRQNFAFWLPAAEILQGWARSVSGNTAEGIAWIEDAIRNYRATGAMLRMPYFLALKAESLQLADRLPEALAAITEAEAWVERSEERWWCAELHRLRGVFLAAMGADKAQVEASFQAAMRTAREQRSISLSRRAEATYAEYRSRK
jgi:serine/threonine protein kinase/tetratricopeptide (TPR) repeat protein